MLIPKRPSSRSSPLRESAYGEDCTMMVPGVCCHDAETTVLAHANSLSSNKGMGYKADDHTGVYACWKCHAWLDQGRASREEKEAAFEAAQIRMIRRLADIATSPAMRPEKVSAARWALQRLAEDSARPSSG